MNLRDYNSAKLRREAIEKKLRLDLSNIGNFSLDESVASTRNNENMIGVAQVPLGIAGPLKINGSSFSDNFFIPLATTEGALVASVSRGAKAISLSRGATSFAHKVGQTRGPVFRINSIEEQRKLYYWVKENQEKIKKVTESTSGHLKFRKAKVASNGDYSYIRFYFDTGDAMGMNMVTIAAEKATELIEKETGVRCIAVAGNFDVDKKPSWMNFINNRGYKVWSEVTLTKKVLNEVLKTNAADFFEVWLSKCLVGSAMSGSMGFNAHYANIIAGIFIATGQDPSHIVEGSMGITTAKIVDRENLHVAIYLPALQIGTIGGGTSLATQTEALNILGVKGSGNAQKFAEIIGGAVLAGEISLLSSLSEGTLAKAHKKLGRGEK